MKPRLTVVVPALNEEASLRATVEAILSQFGSRTSFLEVLIFNDASTDGTGLVANQLAWEDPRVRAFHNPRRLNIGGIYQAGLRLARGDYYVLIPGDNETRVDEVVAHLDLLGLVPLVLFYPTNPAIRPWRRRALSWAYVHLVNALFGLRVRYLNGTNLCRTEVARCLPIRSEGFAYAMEAVVLALRRGVGCAQVGIALQPRQTGRSTALSWGNLLGVAGALGRLWWAEVVVGPNPRRHGAIYTVPE